MIAPAVAAIVCLFVGGLGFAALQSVGGYGVLADMEFVRSLVLTLQVAAMATILSAIIAVAVAVAVHASAADWPWLRSLLQFPIAMPHLALGVAVIHIIAPSGLIARVLYSMGLLDIPAQFPELLNDRFGIGIVLVYVMKESPFLAVLCLAVLARIDPDLYAAAATLGASRWQRLRWVTLPLVWPALAAGSLVVFAFVVSAFEIPFLLGRPFPSMLGVVAQRKFMGVDIAERPEGVAVAIAGALISVIVMFAAYRLQQRSPYRLPDS